MTPPTQQDVSALSLTLFGPLEVLVDGKPLPPVRSRKVVWLLALLALRHGRPVEREWLAGTLWPDSDQTQALANLRPALSQLRAALGSHASRLDASSRHALQLNLNGAEVDVVAFDAAIASKQIGAVERAMTLYRGPLLEGCGEEWVFQERNQREQACLAALQRLAETALQTGDHVKAVVYLRRIIGIDPLSDVAHQVLMDALARSGDRNAALDVFRDFAERLRRDLGASPHEETVSLYHRLRKEARNNKIQVSPQPTDAAPEATPVVSGHLTNIVTELFGREDERMDVSLLLRRCRLVTLLGPGGIGKTRLVAALSVEVVRDYPDGVWLVGLESLPASGGISDKGATLPLIQQMAAVLEVKETAGQTLLSIIAEHLRRKRLLLVLDNCEHVVAACGDLAAHLMQKCPHVRLLATSREALRITGETVYHVPPLAVPAEPDCLPFGSTALLRAVSAYDSVQLFVDRARRTGRNTFELTQDNAPAVAQICRQLEGLPLALELAAARVRVMSVGQIAERLNDHLSGPLGLLKGGSRSAQVRQQTLRATLDWSYSLLSEPERVLLHRLSVFAGGWSLEAAEACSGSEDANGVHVEPVLDVLTALVDKSLVHFEEDDGVGGGRYRFLETVRQYAAERLEAFGEKEPFQSKHHDYFLSLVEIADVKLKGSEQTAWLRRLNIERDNVRGALEWALTKKPESGLQMADALWRFWYMQGHYSEGRAYLTQALSLAEEQAMTVTAAALSGVGALAKCQGDIDAAWGYYSRSIEMYRVLEDTAGIAVLLSNMGIVASTRGDHNKARALYEESLSLHRAMNNERSAAKALTNLAKTVLNTDPAAARPLYDEALSLSRKVGDWYNVGIVLEALCILTCGQGDYQAAQAFAEESLALARESGDRSSVANVLSSLGAVYLSLGDFASAQTCFDESLHLLDTLGDRMRKGWALVGLGDVAFVQNNADLAWTRYEQSRQLFHEIGDVKGESWALQSQGGAARLRGDNHEAQGLYRQAITIFRRVGDTLQMTDGLRGLAAVLLGCGKVVKAACLWGSAEAMGEVNGECLSPLEQEKYDHWVAQARMTLGDKAFADAWEKGRSLTWEQASECALSDD